MAAKLVFPKVLQVHAPGINFYVIREEDELTLIDAGFLFGERMLRDALANVRWSECAIARVVLTHGHFDHTYNVSRFQRGGAQVWAHPLDREHIAGRYPYKGRSRICGILEAAGRGVLGYEVPQVDVWLKEGDVLPILKGLRVVHLPGHTNGHVGFYWQEEKILFSGDLIASYGWGSHLPPAFLNVCERTLRESVDKALDLELNGLLPNHSDLASPETHLERLRGIQQRWRK